MTRYVAFNGEPVAPCGPHGTIPDHWCPASSERAPFCGFETEIAFEVP